MAFDKTTREHDWSRPKFRDYIKVSVKSGTAWPDIPFNVGPQFEGERISAKDMYCELGGPKAPFKAELITHGSMEDTEDGKTTVIGPDIDQLQEGGSYSYGFEVKLAGDLTEELTVALTNRLHYWSNYIQGMMHLNARDTVWVRIDKGLVKKGFKLELWGKILTRLFKAELSAKVKKVQITIITDLNKVEEFYNGAKKIFAVRDKKASELSEDLKPWYTCTLCQSFAPSHACLISPERPAACGALNWSSAKAGYEMDPQGTWQPFDPGECVDPVRGEWTGASKALAEKSGGINTRVFLHTMFQYPHTICGCFESLAFFMPEVDGIAICDRRYTAPTVNGLSFSTMAARAAGGQQVEGMVGVSRAYMRSKKFFMGDGGWKRVVWVDSELMKEVDEAIPADVKGKIASEKDASSIEQLKTFLKDKGHPVVERWQVAKVTPEQVLKYLEDHGGELDMEQATKNLGTTEDHVLAAVEELKKQGILE